MIKNQKSIQAGQIILVKSAGEFLNYKFEKWIPNCGVKIHSLQTNNITWQFNNHRLLFKFTFDNSLSANYVV